MKRKGDVFDEEYLVKGIREMDREAFSALFDAYYVSLVMFCGTYIDDLEQCRDIVSSVFAHLWEKGRVIQIDRSLKSYLLLAVRNRALNHIRHRKVVDSHIRDMASDGLMATHDVDNYILYQEMKDRLEKTVASMPEKIQQTYRFYMEEGMKSKDIALVQNVTQRTVELRLNKAFDLLRKSLFLAFLMFFVRL